MICKSCNFENKEGAVFCAKCGAPLASDGEITELVAEEDKAPETVSEEPEAKEPEKESADKEAAKAEEPKEDAPADDDNEEERTTVLTSNSALEEMGKKAQALNEAASAPIPAPMPTPAPASAPMNGPAPAPMGRPASANPAPMNGPAPAPMGRPASANPAPMNGPAPAPTGVPANARPVPMNNGPMNQQPPQNNKPPKAPKQPKEKQADGKMKTGAKVYIVISIILILACIGVGVWGFLTYTKKIDDLKKDKKALENQIEENQAIISDMQASIDDKNDEISDLEDTRDELQDMCDVYEQQIADYEESNKEYAAYDSMINFANSSTGQGYADFFVSDTVLHLTGGEVAVKLYFANQGNVYFTVGDTSVASCQWSDSFENDVASLYVTPVGSGNTKITITNDVNDEEIVIFVYVD